jgi:basic membrane protein A
VDTVAQIRHHGMLPWGKGSLMGSRFSATAVAGAAAVALLLAGCGSKSGGGNTSAPAPPPGGNSGGSSQPGAAAFKACMVLDTGGVDDKSFNQSSWAGMQAAKQQNPNIDVSYVPSKSGNDYTPNLTAETSKGCQTVVAVGGLMFDNVKAIAAKNPSTHYAEVDAPSTGPNVYGIQFNTAQGAFLGGYLAAAYSKTGKVATWGGLPIGPVTIYMDGFWEGVQYYNQQNHKNVQVLGWDETNQKGGTFVNEGANSFNDLNKGKQISQTFIQEGADVIFPVAGGSGQGAVSAAAASNGAVSVMWVDVDGCVSLPQDCKYFLTSVTKNLSGAVTAYVTKAASGSFPTGSYIGTLANEGTGLAPFHDFDSKVSSDIKSQLADVAAKIKDGTIKIKSPSQPSA